MKPDKQQPPLINNKMKEPNFVKRISKTVIVIPKKKNRSINLHS